MIFLMSILEMFFSLIYYNILFNNNYKNNIIKNILFSVCLASTYQVIPSENSNITFIISVIILSLSVSYIDKKETILVGVEMLFSLIIVGVVEGIIGVTTLLHILENIDFTILFFVEGIPTFILMGIILNIIIKKYKINLEKILNTNRIIWILIINIMFFLLIIRITLKDSLFSGKEYIEYSLLLIGLAIVNIYCYRNLFTELEEKKKLEISREYMSVIDELLDKFRANEHEYKNHLSTLNSIVLLSEEESLKAKVGSYIEEIEKQDTYSSLMYIDSTIIKAILYNKIKECEDKKIHFENKIGSNFSNISLGDTELSIVLNNLLNNAIDAVSNLDNKYINITISEKEKCNIIVKNSIETSKEINFIDIFKKGESTKGENRGYGLFTVKKIVEKYKGTIQLSIENGYFILFITF